MSSNEEALSNSIAFMNHPQDGKGMLFIFAEKKVKKWKGEKIRKPRAFRDLNSGEQPSLENKQQQKLTASFSVNVHLLEPAVWGLAEAGQTEASGIQIFK